jgi:alkylation response protein AidB-like acyl-CoA dehydrogenase
MSYLEYDLTLSDEEQELRDAAHKFAEEVLRPTGIELDRMAPEDTVAPGSPLFDVVRQASELGYTRVIGPASLGGMELAPRASHIVYEELAWGSVGLAGVIFLSSTHADVALATMNQEVIGEFAIPYYGSSDGSMLGCWAITEPDHGSDTLAMVSPDLRVKARAQLVARADGDEYVLNGQKSAWVSNGPIATHAMLNVQLDPDGTMADGGICLLPLDLPGISRGPALDKHGCRSLPQGELFFDEVRVPKRWMVMGVEAYGDYMNAHLTLFNAGVSCVATGLARAAYDATLAYCKERVQGGRPIFEHQSVRARLFRMFSLVQASRALSRSVYVHNLTKILSLQPGQLQHSIAAKVFCTEAALEVTTLAVQLHGGNGMTREYPVEMFLRDAVSFTVADGENALLSQVAASRL